MAQPEIKVLPNAAELTAEAARRIVSAAAEKLSDPHHFFSLFLSGGNTPKALYELLASEPYRSQLNWSNVEIYFGDERCVPPDHPDSNFLMAYNAMLSKLPIPEPNIHRMRAELEPEQAATEYGQLLRDRFQERRPDIVLLGMGDDGHTASLFPGTAALNETKHRCVANFVPKLNAWRITTTYPFLNTARRVLILAAGANKAQRLAEVLEGPRDPQRLPIQGIDPAGQLTWLLDAPAAGMTAAGKVPPPDDHSR
jgi:6-phosphogluconolactonase